MPVTHTLKPDPGNVHGYFSHELAPVLTVDSGDTVEITTLEAGWWLEPYRPDGQPRQVYEKKDPGNDTGHALCGPIAIRGAEPGMALEIRIAKIRPGAWGWLASGGWEGPINRRLGIVGESDMTIRWTLDADRMIGTSDHGHEVTLKPFFGVMGMPPAEPGVHSTGPPRATGGNLDCKELVSGSSLFLPIAVSGGLFSAGDGHGLQGDGEICGTAIECPIDYAELTFVVHPSIEITAPRAKTPAGWLTFGLDENLNEAMLQATEAMIELMVDELGMTRRIAIAMSSLAVDLRITQVANGVWGVHAVLPHGTVREASESADQVLQ